MYSIENSPVFTVSEIQDWWDEQEHSPEINRMCVTPSSEANTWDVWIGWEDGEGTVIEEFFVSIDESELDNLETWFNEHMPYVHQYSR
jgi:hypothetical protein